MEKGCLNIVTGMGHSSRYLGTTASSIHRPRTERTETGPESTGHSGIKTEVRAAGPSDVNADVTNRNYMLYGALFLLFVYIAIKSD